MTENHGARFSRFGASVQNLFPGRNLEVINKKMTLQSISAAGISPLTIFLAECQCRAAGIQTELLSK